MGSRLPCCIPASSIAVAMRKNSYAVSPKPGLRQTVGVNCFAAATLLVHDQAASKILPTCRMIP